jgi:hypothetical protein
MRVAEKTYHLPPLREGYSSFLKEEMANAENRIA